MKSPGQISHEIECSCPNNQKKTSDKIFVKFVACLSKASQVEVPDGKSICPDRPRRKVPMSRPSQTESAYVQTFVRSPDLRAFMSRLSCVHQTFVRSCPDFRAFTRLSCVHVQTFVRSCPDFRAFDRLSCVHQTFVRSPDFCAFMSRTFVRSPNFRAFARLSCVHDQTFVRSPDYSCVHVQTFVRFSLFPDHVNLNARHPRRAFIWVWTYRLSVWDLNLGCILNAVKIGNENEFE